MNKEDKSEMYDEPSVFAIPCDKPFVVASDKAKEFFQVQPNQELTEKREELIKKLNIKFEIEPIKFEGLILRKTKK